MCRSSNTHFKREVANEAELITQEGRYHLELDSIYHKTIYHLLLNAADKMFYSCRGGEQCRVNISAEVLLQRRRLFGWEEGMVRVR